VVALTQDVTYLKSLVQGGANVQQPTSPAPNPFLTNTNYTPPNPQPNVFQTTVTKPNNPFASNVTY
jgi:hypothetical protein